MVKCFLQQREQGAKPGVNGSLGSLSSALNDKYLAYYPTPCWSQLDCLCPVLPPWKSPIESGMCVMAIIPPSLVKLFVFFVTRHCIQRISCTDCFNWCPSNALTEPLAFRPNQRNKQTWCTRSTDHASRTVAHLNVSQSHPRCASPGCSQLISNKVARRWWI